jgi:thioredoxin reductase
MSPVQLDHLIIGAGPAGCQLGYFLEQAGRDYLILEAGEGPGTFFRTFPRHRTLISSNKRHTGWSDGELNLRMDWNSLLSDNSRLLFTGYCERYFPPADDMVRYLSDFAAASGLRIQSNTRVSRISRDGNFRVTDEQGRVYASKCLIAATGVSKPFIPSIPGIETAEVYTSVPVEPQGFTDQRVLIIGKGNSAFETADNLIETAAVIHLAGPRSIRLAWRTHFVGHLRAVNNNFLDTYQLKSQNALLDGDIEQIEHRNGSYIVRFRFTRANEVTKDLQYDRVIVCTGFRFDDSIFDDSCRPELVISNRFPAQTSEWESTNVPDLYFAGTLMQVRDYRKSTSGFIHGFRYCVRALYRMFESKYGNHPWPSRSFPADAPAMTEAVIGRVNRTSALWQQFGFLCDLIVVRRDGVATYYEELPVAYVHEKYSNEENYFVITLEYGPDHDRFDPFDVAVGRIKQTDHDRSSDSRYLHPVVSHYCRGVLAREHHVTENLENDWTGPTHREPLETAFAEILAKQHVLL